MALSEQQLRFLEDFVLRHRIRRAAAQDGQPDTTPPPEPGAVDPDEVRRIMAQAAGLKNPEGISDKDAGVLTGHRAAISGFLDHPLTESGLRAAAREVQAMSGAHQAIEERTRQDRQRREQEAAKITRQVGDALQNLEPGTLEPAATDITKEAARICTTLTGLPDDPALEAAVLALDGLEKSVFSANEAAGQDRRDRIEQRDDLLRELSGVAALDEGQPDEKQARSELAQQVRAPLQDETPSHVALKQAREALDRLNQHVQDVQKEIDRVRKPRFEKGRQVLAAFAAISLDMPRGCPLEARQELLDEQSELSGMLAPMRDWAMIDDWDAEDLIGINDRLDKLALNAKTLRRDVEQAAKALQEARDMATRAINPTGGAGFSVAQTQQMDKMFRIASQQGEQNVLQAGEPIRALEDLARHAAKTARIREGVMKRIAGWAKNPPVGVSGAQKEEWARLRRDATDAADEVLEP